MSIVKISSIILIIFGLTACSTSKEDKAEALYNTQCASCHMAPNIADLPRKLWKEGVLPDMGARMGMKEATYSPFSGYSFSEQEAMMRTGIYHVKPVISKEDWVLLKNYILAMAPETLDSIPLKKIHKECSQFISKAVNVDSVKGSFITFLAIKPEEEAVVMADIAGNILKYDTAENKIIRSGNYANACTSYVESDSVNFITLVGILNPSEIARGKIYEVSSARTEEIATNLHRPVHTSVEDLNNNGVNELLVCEFGHLTGNLVLLYKDQNSEYKKKILLNQPGIVRTIIRDMNDDGKKDIVLLSTQGNEGVTILFQKDDLTFTSEQVIRFSPIYGSSWFEVLDYNGDGYDDIITVNGDNADKTYVQKPYHGMRIFINDGNANFEERYFYPLNGATRFVAKDFDQDGDIDFGLIAAFPDYERGSENSFVYLENKDAKTFDFKSFSYAMASLGSWLLIDAEDIDNDGDQDMVLSSFTYSLAPASKELTTLWKESNVDLMILENTLK